jgi:excisionase family DNA binding protein
MTESVHEQTDRWVESCSLGEGNDQFLQEIGLETANEALRLGASKVTVDLWFLVFLRRFSRFGYFQFGPIGIDVRLIEDLVERTLPRGGDGQPTEMSEELLPFSRLLMKEVQKSGRRRIDELAYLLTFMRWKEGIPGRVFGELGVAPEQVEAYVRDMAVQGPKAPEKLYSPEEAAEYLGVHIQTVRSWIRAGRLKASRLAGQRALRIRASDLDSVLEPVDPSDL